MRMALHEALLEATKLPHNMLNLLSLRKGSIIVDVEVKGTRTAVEAALSSIHSQISNEAPSILDAPKVLQMSLCKAVLSRADAPCKVTVIHSELLPSPNGTDEEALESTGSVLSEMLPALIVVGVLLLSTIVLIIMRRLTRSKTQHWEDPVTSLPTKDVDAGPEVVNTKSMYIEEFGEKPKNDEEISLAGSTATPTSSRHSQRSVDLEVASVGDQEGAVVSTNEDACPDLV